MQEEIKDFSEKDIRQKILNKIKPGKILKHRKHWAGTIFLNNKKVGKVKIPNDHLRVMKPSKSGKIAAQLKLSPEEFNNLIDCPLTGPIYYRGLAKKLA